MQECTSSFSGERQAICQEFPSLGSGEITLTSDFFSRLANRLSENSGSEYTYHDVKNFSIEIYNLIEQERVEKKAFSPLGYTLSGANNVADIFKDDVSRVAFKELDRVWGQLWAMLAVVDKNSCKLISVGKSEVSTTDRLGYEVTGSGTESAEWSLIHRHFDPNREMKYSIFMALWAKFQVEDSEGVGTQTDGVILQKGL